MRARFSELPAQAPPFALLADTQGGQLAHPASFYCCSTLDCAQLSEPLKEQVEAVRTAVAAAHEAERKVCIFSIGAICWQLRVQES